MEKTTETSTTAERIKAMKKASPFNGVKIKREEVPNRITFSEFSYREPTVDDWIEALKPADDNISEQVSPRKVGMSGEFGSAELETMIVLASRLGKFDGEAWPDTKVRTLPRGFFFALHNELIAMDMIFLSEEE